MSFPAFRYHPDPLATGSVVRSHVVCVCCHGQRGYIYAGPVYARDELAECICPWCIADGSAHGKFNAKFTDTAGIGADSPVTPVPNSVIEEVAFRTPGFLGWQQEHWLACCGDAAAYFGRAGAIELKRQWPSAIPSIREDCAAMSDADWQTYFDALDRDGSPSAYIFGCLHCGRHLGYSDCD